MAGYLQRVVLDLAGIKFFDGGRTRSHERHASVEFLVGMGAVAVDVMQKHLNQAISLKRLAPMKKIDSAVKKAIAR